MAGASQPLDATHASLLDLDLGELLEVASEAPPFPLGLVRHLACDLQPSEVTPHPGGPGEHAHALGGPRTRAALSEYQQAYRLTELKEAELLDHMKVRAHFRRGYELQVRGKFRDSIGQYSEVLRLDPEHFSAYFNRGLIYYAEHRDDRAIEDFGQAIGLRPDYAGAYVNRGNAYYRQGAYASAARDYLKAIGIWVTPW